MLIPPSVAHRFALRLFDQAEDGRQGRRTREDALDEDLELLLNAELELVLNLSRKKRRCLNGCSWVGRRPVASLNVSIGPGRTVRDEWEA